MRVRVLAEAAEELEQAALWYEQESPDLGLRLIEAFENAVQLLREDEFVVVALAHFARRPGYWKERALT